jgi:hypothetical protein
VPIDWPLPTQGSVTQEAVHVNAYLHQTVTYSRPSSQILSYRTQQWTLSVSHVMSLPAQTL